MLPVKNMARNLHKLTVQPGYAWRAAAKRFKSYLSYKFFDGYSAYPETISLFLNYRCNLRCPMCGQWGDVGAFKNFSAETVRSQLPVDDAISVVQDVRGFKPTITLFGGEPMMHTGWLKVLEAIKSAGLRCNMVTNGTLLGRCAEEVVELGLDEIVLSLDGPREIHDEMRGREGTFDLAMQGFEALNRAKRRRRHRKPVVQVNCTIYESNYRRLGELLPISEAIGARTVTFHHLLFLGADTVSRHNTMFEAQFGHRCQEWAGFVRETLPAINPERLLEEIEAIGRSRTAVRSNFYPNFTAEEIQRYYSDFEFTSSSYPNRCLSLWMAAYVFPNGDVRPYHSMDYSLGNIKEAGFKTIWNNEKFQAYRRFIKRHRRFPVCARGCTELYRY